MTEKNKKKIKKIADFIKNYWALVGIFFAVSGFFYNLTFGTVIKINDQLSEIKNIATENQKMTLRNTIWNDKIPVEDRALACDIYLELGYNSFTKTKCERILMEGYDMNEKSME